MRLEIKNLLINITNTILLIIMIFLTARILFRLFAANNQTPFVSWIYSVSNFLLTPFSGIFNSINIARSGVIDIPAIFAMIAYSIIGLVIYYIIRTLTAGITRDDSELIEDHDHPREARIHTH